MNYVQYDTEEYNCACFEQPNNSDPRDPGFKVQKERKLNSDKMVSADSKKKSLKKKKTISNHSEQLEKNQQIDSYYFNNNQPRKETPKIGFMEPLKLNSFGEQKPKQTHQNQELTKASINFHPYSQRHSKPVHAFPSKFSNMQQFQPFYQFQPQKHDRKSGSQNFTQLNRNNGFVSPPSAHTIFKSQSNVQPFFQMKTQNPRVQNMRAQNLKGISKIQLHSYSERAKINNFDTVRSPQPGVQQQYYRSQVMPQTQQQIRIPQFQDLAKGPEPKEGRVFHSHEQHHRVPSSQEHKIVRPLAYQNYQQVRMVQPDQNKLKKSNQLFQQRNFFTDKVRQSRPQIRSPQAQINFVQNKIQKINLSRKQSQKQSPREIKKQFQFNRQAQKEFQRQKKMPVPQLQKFQTCQKFPLQGSESKRSKHEQKRTRIEAKQIESEVDEGQFEDNISEVIGHEFMFGRMEEIDHSSIRQSRTEEHNTKSQNTRTSQMRGQMRGQMKGSNNNLQSGRFGKVSSGRILGSSPSNQFSFKSQIHNKRDLM